MSFLRFISKAFGCLCRPFQRKGRKIVAEKAEEAAVQQAPLPAEKAASPRREKRKLREFFHLKRLDTYLIKKFIVSYFFSIALIITIVVVFDINEKIDNFMDHDAPLDKIITQYYVNYIPYIVNMFSPLFVFISVIFFTSNLADNSEIIAMQSCGMSFNRLMRPYFISAAFIALLNFALSTYFIPQGNKKRIDFEDQYVKKKKSEFVTNIQLEVDEGVVAYIERYESGRETGYNFSLDKFDGKQLVSRLTATSIKYDDEKENLWHIRDYTLRNLHRGEEKMTRGVVMDSIIDMSPEDFFLLKGQQETMTSPQLLQYIEKQTQRGVGNLKVFEIEYHKRIAASFASFILTLIGLSLSSRKIKGGMGMNLGIGLALSFSYILFQSLSATFSASGSMPSWLAVWLPNIVFSFIALYLYIYKAPR